MPKLTSTATTPKRAEPTIKPPSAVESLLASEPPVMAVGLLAECAHLRLMLHQVGGFEVVERGGDVVDRLWRTMRMVFGTAPPRPSVHNTEKARAFADALLRNTDGPQHPLREAVDAALDVVVAYLRDQDEDAQTGGQSETALYALGDRQYRLGKRPPFVVSGSEDQILEAFIDRESMDTKTLVNKSRNDDADKIFTRLHDRLIKQNPGVNIAMRSRPGGKNALGYYAKVIPTDLPNRAAEST
jgi:hypothetical protein